MKIQTISIFIILTIALMAAGCKKEDDTLTPEQQFSLDISIIEDYLASKNLTAESTPSGLHYIITEEGPGESPTPENIVTVKYRGYLTNGTVFDQTSPANVLTFPLKGLIPGWIEGIPFLRSGGGKGTFLIPSKLGYGSTATGAIPANSVIIFDVTLIDFE